MKILKKVTPLLYLSIISVMAQGCVRSELEVSALGAGGVSELLIDGTPEAVGVLALLNHPQTSSVMLDESVGLDVRAADAIVDARDGEDGRPQTEDDQLFLSVDDVDSVSWVGPAALNSLQYYVVNYGWVPLGNETLGTWDGVEFTVEEAELVLGLANTASVDNLDHEVRLDSRAVDSIVAARPIQTVLELSELWYVGGSALENLKLYTQGEPVGNSYCEPSVVNIEDNRTENMNEMFRELDAKGGRFSAFYSYRITGCDGFVGDAELERLVAEEIALTTAIVGVDQMGDFSGGVDSFESLIFSAMQRSSEEQLDGDRTDEASIELLETEASQFISDLERGPYELLEVWMYGQERGCTEELVAALEVESRRLVVFSASAGCQ